MKKPDVEFDPVYGLSRRAVEEWLARNPRLQSEHELELWLIRNPPLHEEYEAARLQRKLELASGGSDGGEKG